MPNYKNIRIKKRGGGTRLQRVQVLSSGKYKFVKNIKGKSKSKAKSSSKTSKSKSKNKSRKGRNNRMGKRKLTLPLALIAPVANLIFGSDAAGNSVFSEIQAGRTGPAMDHLMASLTGYHPATGWQAEHLQKGLVPILIGVAVHKFVGGAPMNVNRMLANAGVPIIRI